MAAPVPDGEAERLAALRAHQILDTAPEAGFDDLVRLAAHVCGTPIAAVSLIDADRQWFKAVVGLDAQEVPRDISFCAHTILQPDLLVIRDTQADPRFADNPLVTDAPSIRFYAGAPLITEDGHALGSLCVVDRTPRRLTPAQTDALSALGRLASIQVGLARRLTEQRQLTADRDRAEEARRRSEARLAEAQRVARVGSWEYDIATGAFTWSEEMFRLFEMEPADGEPSLEALRSRCYPEDMAQYSAAVQQATQESPQEDHAHEFDLRILRRDGTVRWAHAVGRGECDATGRVARLFGTLTDIHERKTVEMALQKERQFQKALLENLQEGIVACDAEGTLQLFNRATREFHGLPAEPLPPEEWGEHFDLYGADGLTPMATGDIPLFRALQGEVVRGIEMVIAPKGDAPRRALLASGQPLLGTDGEKLGAVVAMHDVTEERQTRRELSRLAAIVDSSHDAILGTTLDGTVVSWNTGAERLYGYTAAEVIGRHASFLDTPGRGGSIPGVIARLRGGETIGPMDTVRVRRDGTEFHAVLSFSPICDEAGGMIGLSCIARDATARAEAEAALRRSEARLAEAQRVARIGSWEYDIAGNRITWSEELFRLFEMEPADGEPSVEALMGRYHPDDVAMHMDVTSRAMSDGLPYEFDLRILRRDGTARWAHAVGRGERDGTGRVARLFGTLTDIHERKTMEEARRESTERLRRSEARLVEAQQIARIGDWEYDLTTHRITCSAEVYRLLEFDPAAGEPSYEDVQARYHPEDRAERNRLFTQALATGEPYQCDLRLILPSGTARWCHLVGRPARNAAGVVTHVAGTLMDVTERIASEERFRVPFERSSDAHLLLSEDGILDCNDAAVALLRCTDKSQVLSLHPAVLSPEFQPDGRASLEKCLEMDAQAREHGFHRFEWTHRKMSGEEFPVEVTLTPVTLEDRPVLLVVWHDLTDRKRVEEAIRDHAIVLEFQKGQLEAVNRELAALATTDGLTGLTNHRAFQERLAEEIRRAERYGTPLSVIFLDVDHFKNYNDRYGHPAGDAVLRGVAGLLRETGRETDLVARYGGEEFVIVLPQTDGSAATAVAERVRAAIAAAPWQLHPITASFGVAALRQGVENSGDLISRADQALYEAKTGGRNRVVLAGSGCSTVAESGATESQEALRPG